VYDLVIASSSPPLAGYVRVSTSAQAESGIGLAAQRRLLADAATQHGLDVGEVYADEGKSGAKMSNRPALQAALAAIRAGDASGLIVAKIDRLGRSAAEVLALVEQARRDGWRLVALDAGLDTATPAGELVAGMLALAARFEHRRISERQVEKFDELRRQGRARGRVSTPSDIADRIRELRHTGATWQAIADELNARGVPTTRGGLTWRPSSSRSAYLTREVELAAQTT
jgi:DNA invertase Pin-like site-specific DNA recombinase